MNKITEKDNIHQEWYKEAKNQTEESLPSFISHLNNDYEHDYGTACHVVAACSLAGAHAVAAKQGITGFQASLIMWQFIKEWSYSDNKSGLKIIDYDNLLFPQYSHHFDKVISDSVWKNLQKQANENISRADEEYEKYLVKYKKYLIDLEEFINEFPDYTTNPEKYEHIRMGTAEEHDAEALKIKSGFKFAPIKPYPGCYQNRVYTHWVSIVNGNVPFGFTVTDK